MSEPTLLHLHLGASLQYAYMPPETNPLAEILPGEERIWAFKPDDIVENDCDAGPRVKRPLPKPGFAGSSPIKGCHGNCGTEDSACSLPAGDYLFLQWRRNAYQSIEDGLEDFIRQIWWEGEKTEGPWILRIVAEDGNTAFQGLRMISSP